MREPTIEQLLAQFAANTDPRLDVWRRVPDVTQEEDESTDDYACLEVSTALAKFLASHGREAWLIEATRFDHGWVFDHAWVAVREGLALSPVHVDFTARQFHNLPGLPRDWVTTRSWPLRWLDPLMPHEHPFAGRFRKATITEAKHLT